MKAEFVKILDGPTLFHCQKLWKVGDEFIVTSTIDVGDPVIPETCVFHADKNGKIEDWTIPEGNFHDDFKLAGSFSGGFDHERAINGYAASLENEA